MAQSLKSSVANLRKRASGLNALVDKETHPQVSLSLQRACAGLTASALLLPHLESAGLSYIKRKTRLAKTQKDQNAAKADVVISFKTLIFSFQKLLKSASLMAEGRDAEVIKVLGHRSLELVLKIGAVVSGVKYIKDAAEVLDILREAVSTGQVIKLRRQQVRAASDLLRWADAIKLTTLTWCFAAELFALGTVGKGQTPTSTILAHVVRRIDRAERYWKTP